MKRALSILLSILLLFSLLTGCGAGSETAADNSKIEYSYEMPAEAVSDGSASLTSGSSLTAVSSDRKLIKTVHLTAETEDYDALLTGLDQQITELGGYVESRETDTYRRRSCAMTVRVPADSLDGFVEHVSANANVTSSTETADDVTLEYVDTEAKVTALETEQERLLELLANAESLSDILEIEARLSDVTYELERYASQLRTLANQVDYATVYLNLYEVETLTPTEDPTVWQRITSGFAETLDDLGEGITDLFVWVVVNSPYLLVWAVVICLLVLVIRKISRKKPKKQAPPPPAAE